MRVPVPVLTIYCVRYIVIVRSGTRVAETIAKRKLLLNVNREQQCDNTFITKRQIAGSNVSIACHLFVDNICDFIGACGGIIGIWKMPKISVDAKVRHDQSMSAKSPLLRWIFFPFHFFFHCSFIVVDLI